MSDDRTTMPERMQKTQVQLDRIRGCLIGGAAGDALGYPVEFFSEHTLWARCGDDGIQEYELDPVRDKALISDDTQMTLFTANGILCGETRMATRPQRRAPPTAMSADPIRTGCLHSRHPSRSEAPPAASPGCWRSRSCTAAERPATPACPRSRSKKRTRTAR